MENLEKQMIRMESAVEKLETGATKMEQIMIDVAVMKNQSKMQAVKELIHYGITTVALALGIKSNV